MTMGNQCFSQGLSGLVLAVLMSFGGAVDAQPKADATPEELRKLKEEAELRKDLYKALQEADAAKRAYEAALDPAKQAAADQSAALKSTKEAAEAQTAAANAQKAQYEAELAGLKKKFGEFSGSGIGGTAEVGTGAGSAEANLLGGLAVQRIAAAFATTLKGTAPTTFILATSTTAPDFQALTAFDAQHLAMSAAMVQARSSTTTSPDKNAGVRIEGVAEIGAGLEAVSKILSFAKTDYKFVALDIVSSDAMLLRALAGQLTPKTAEIPAIYVADMTAPTNAVLSKAADINKWGVEAKKGIKFFEASIAAFEKAVAAAPNDETLKAGLSRARESLATWKAVSESLDAWSKQLTTSDDKGNSPIATVIRQSAIKRKLESGAALVIIELHKVAGTGYTKKNLWSSLGANPFYVMGGAVASYVALDGKTGEVLASQLLPVHGGYHSISEVRGEVNRGLPTPSP